MFRILIWEEKYLFSFKKRNLRSFPVKQEGKRIRRSLAVIQRIHQCTNLQFQVFSSIPAWKSPNERYSKTPHIFPCVFDTVIGYWTFFLNFVFSLFTNMNKYRTTNLFTTNSKINATKKKAITSSRKYWKKLSFSAATLRCSAPLCLMTYSTQNTNLSWAATGLSFNNWDLFLAFSEYLWNIIVISSIKFDRNIIPHKNCRWIDSTHLGLERISSNSNFRTFSVISFRINHLAKPKAVALLALSIWSPKIGKQRQGFPLFTASRVLKIPEWVMKSFTFLWAEKNCDIKKYFNSKFSFESNWTHAEVVNGRARTLHI